MPAEDFFPRAANYPLEWQVRNQMGPNALWLAESLTAVMELRPGMRVLDLGCGRALTSIFLAREFGLQVWAADLWISPGENWDRIREAGLEASAFPLRVEAHQLPFAPGFFDAIISIDAFHYFGTDVHYLETHLLKHLKPGGVIGIASPASPVEIADPAPAYMRERYYWMNSVAWWGRHWSRTPGLAVERAEALPHGHELWLRWMEICAEAGDPGYAAHGGLEEHRDLVEDAGRYLGFVRMTARRAAG